MVRVTRHSKKDDLWLEVERLRQASDQQQNKTAILETSVESLREENSRLQERTRFMEELSERIRAETEKLEILTNISKELASFDLDGVLEVCVQRIPFMVRARYASVYLYDRQRNRLILKQSTHDREIDPEVDLSRNPDSLMAVAVREQKTLCIDDLGNFVVSGGSTPTRPYRECYQTSSCVVAALVAAGEVEGVLNLADRLDSQPFNPEAQMGLIRQACELLAVSLRNARLFDQVQAAARTCSLTGLLNRQAVMENLDIEVKRAARYQNDLSVLVGRVHGVRLINANHGHQAGDHILQTVGRELAGNVRNVDVVGRTEGTEFCIILPEQLTSGALVVARRLSKILTETEFEVGDTSHQLQATIGVGEYRRSGSGADLYQQAVDRLEEARSVGEPIGWSRAEP